MNTTFKKTKSSTNLASTNNHNGLVPPPDVPLVEHDWESLKPCISSTTILATGFCIYACAIIWPPILLLFTYLLSKFIPYCFLCNDEAVSRRKLWKKMEARAKYSGPNDEHYKILFPDEKEVILEEKYWVNERGMCLMTSIMTPAEKDIEAVLCFCHGYMDNQSFLKRYEYQRLVKRGIAFVSIEYEGHGRSDGHLCYIPKWDNMIQDVLSYFQEACSDARFQGKKVFLMGESMGGAVAFDVFNTCSREGGSPDHFKFTGVVLCCPMAKISEELLPSPFVIDAFERIVGPSGCERLIGLLPLAPTGVMNGFRLVHKRALSQSVPSWYGYRKPRLATGRELLLTTKRISSSLKTFDAPVLILHGLADTVTDPKLSQDLFNECSSQDKEIKLYEGMMHALTAGEPNENIDIVFTDVINWIEARI